MSDSGPSSKKPALPSWQMKPTDKTPGDSEKPQPGSSELPRAAVVEHAKRFLEEDEVKNASTDKKIEFLECKGLHGDEIQELLGISRNIDATNSLETQESSHKTLTADTSISQPTSAAPYSQQTRDIPPIITYPEFLVTPTSPAPLITKTRLLTTLYLFGGLSAFLYGTNSYLITPMLDSLTSSRLSLAETASTNLSRLISKLEATVSEIPPTTAHSHQNGLSKQDEDEDSDSDPSELFHRDIGVQTSLPNTPSLSRPGTPTPSPSNTLEEQTSHLSSFTGSMTSLIEDSTSEGHDVDDLSVSISILREYLESLAYVTPSQGYGYGVNSYGGGSLGGSSKEADDEISRLKAQIRGVKGVLLSARSFPGGTTRLR